jgi:4-hydroxy-2-oxoheptanedioate aldolase
MTSNRIRQLLRDNGTIHGCFLRYPDAGITELLALQGWDFIVLDAEHGPVQPHDCEQMVRSAELHGVAALARLPSCRNDHIQRYLDTGLMGLHAPCVGSRAEAEAIVSAAKYFPLGQRGLAAVRGAQYGQKQSLKDYAQYANANTVIVAQIETAEGLERLDDIAQVEGIDVIFIGPTDLSQSLGYPGELDHPAVQSAISRIIACANQHKKPWGIMVGDAESARSWRSRGARYIAVTFESMVRSACQSFLSTIKS